MLTPLSQTSPQSGLLETGDQAEGRGLAASRGTQQRKEAPAGYFQRDTGDGPVRAVILGNASQLQDGVHCKAW